MHALPSDFVTVLTEALEVLPGIYGAEASEFKNEFVMKLHKRFCRYATIEEFRSLAQEKVELQAAVHLSGLVLRFTTRDPMPDVRTFLFHLTCLEYSALIFTKRLQHLDRLYQGNVNESGRQLVAEPVNPERIAAAARNAEMLQRWQDYRASLPGSIAESITTPVYQIHLTPESEHCIHEEDKKMLALVDIGRQFLAGAEHSWSYLFQSYSVLDSLAVAAEPSDAFTFVGPRTVDPRRGSDESDSSHGGLSELSGHDGRSLGSRE